MTYDEFLKAKIAMEVPRGEQVEIGDVNPILLPHQAATVQWMVNGERRNSQALARRPFFRA